MSDTSTQSSSVTDIIGPQSSGAVVGLGIASLVMTVLISLAISASFEPEVYQTWVSLFFVAAVPTQIVMALVWNFEVPGILKNLSQPLKGVVCLVIASIAGLIFGFLLLFGPVGQGLVMPTPMLIMYQIISVPAILWMLSIMQMWPFRVISTHPVFLGFALVISCYLVATVIFYVFYNFSFLQGTPLYVASLDPGGLFNAWSSQTFIITSIAFLFVLLMFDYWPISLLPGASTQPLMGIYGTLFILVCGGLTYGFFTVVLGWDRVQFLVAGPISFIFGFFVLNDFLKGQLFISFPPPLRGMCLCVSALVVAVILHSLYSFIAPYIAGRSLLTGAPTYEAEIWIATALLGVTFPMIIVTTGFFNFWPLVRNPSKVSAQAKS